jgi:hypothetical protein
MNEHEQVVLLEDLAAYGLAAGDVGVIVHIYHDGRAYEVEFFSLEGETLSIVTVETSQVRAVKRGDVLHARTRTIPGTVW